MRIEQNNDIIIYLEIGKVFCVAISLLIFLSFFVSVRIYHNCKAKYIESLQSEQVNSVNRDKDTLEDEVTIFSMYFILFFLYLKVSLFQHFTYFWVFLKNPGIVYQPEYSPTTTSRRTSVIYIKLYGYYESRFCTICKAIKNSQRLHCIYCDICIEEYSHHCPWIGKCVGQNNYTSFQLLKFFTALYFLVGMFALYSSK